MTTHNEIIPEGMLVEAGLASRIRKDMEKNRPKAALGNMKTHLYLDENPEWVTVGRRDLNKVLEYIASLESKQVLLLKKIEENPSS